MRPEPVVLLTRPAGENERLAARLAEAGFAAQIAPCVRIVMLDDRAPLQEALRRLAPADALVVTSRAGVRAIAIALGEATCVAPIAAVGPATADACRVAGLRVTFVPSIPSGAALAEELPLPRGMILMARSDRASTVPAEILRARGAVVEELVAYRTEPVTPPIVRPVDAIVFASPSAVDGYARAGAQANGPVIVIGPATAARVRERLGVEPFAATPDDGAIADLVRSAVGGRHAAARR
jgi:uroporphyrinogen-III synthase